MADGVIDPPSNNLGLTAGGDTSTTPKGGKNKKVIIAGAALGGLVLIYLYAKSRSSAAATTGTTTAAPQLITPASNQDTYISGLANTLTEQNQAILAQQTANNTSFTNGLSSALKELEGVIAGNQSATLTAISAIPGQPSVAPATPAPAPVTIPTQNVPLAALPAGTNIIGRIIASFSPIGGAPGAAVYVTDQGGVYNAGGSQYYGSSNQPQYNGGQISGGPGQQIVSAIPLPGGGYEEINNKGQTYSFGPGYTIS